MTISNPRWNNSRPSPSKEIRMAEPLHRIPPNGVTQGLSIRDFPKSCIQQVKDICLFYVKKCSGKYHDNKAAARYIHQMAEEVISQLGGVVGEIKKNRAEPELYEALLNEWNDHFPPSLGALGSPKAIAAIIENQTREIESLKSELRQEKSKREKDVSEILRSMDAQLQAYRSSIMEERKKQYFQSKLRLDSHDELVKKMEKDFQIEIENINIRHLEELNLKEKQFEKEREKYNAHIKDLERRISEVQSKRKSDLSKVKEEKNKKIDSLAEKYNKAREKYYQMSFSLGVDNESNSSLSDAESSSSSEEDDSESEFEEVKPFDDSDIDGFKGNKIERDRLKRERKEKKEARILKKKEEKQNKKLEKKKSKLLTFAEPTKEYIKTLTSESKNDNKNDNDSISLESKSTLKSQFSFTGLKHLMKQIDDTQKENEALQIKFNTLNEEIQYHQKEKADILRCMKELERINESLRRALGIQLDSQGFIIHESLRNVKGDTELLCHTPHFLDHPDKSEYMNEKKNMSAYNTAGYF